MKNLLYIAAIFLTTGCVNLSEPYGNLGEMLFGHWEGVQYKTSDGRVVQFTNANQPVYYNVGSDSLIIAVQGKSIHRLYNLRHDNEYSHYKRGREVLNGTDKEGNVISIRMEVGGWGKGELKKQGYGSDWRASSNVIQGLYSPAKDTVTIYYRSKGPGVVEVPWP